MPSPPDKIRILRAITWMPVGGVERKIVEVLPRLNPDRFEVTLACLRERGPLAAELEAAGVPVELVPFRRRWDLSAISRLAGLMRRKRIDIVHSHMYRANVPATAAARWAGVRNVWCQIHNVGTWETSRQLAVDRWLCRWRSGIVAVSERVRRDAIERLRLPESRARVLYNGVDLDRFGGRTPEARAARARDRADLRAQEGAPDQAVIFLLAARLVEQKRPRLFLDLAGELLRREEAGGPQAHFWILGGGPLIDALQRQAQELPHPERARFFGRRDDVWRFMAAADVFAMPSAREGFSNALLEAMASGMAPIATDVGGNAEAVRDGRDGFVIPARSPEALRDAAAKLLADAGLRKSMGESARARAGEFSLEAMVRAVEALYEESASPVSAA